MNCYFKRGILLHSVDHSYVSWCKTSFVKFNKAVLATVYHICPSIQLSDLLFDFTENQCVIILNPSAHHLCKSDTSQLFFLCTQIIKDFFIQLADHFKLLFQMNFSTLQDQRETAVRETAVCCLVFLSFICVFVYINNYYFNSLFSI